MINFLYKAKNDKGQIVTGTVKASNDAEAEKVLLDHKLLPVEMVPERSNSKGAKAAFKIKNREKALFARQLATMISAGLTLPKAIKVVSMQVTNANTKAIYLDIYKELEEGLSFSSALARHPEAFDKVFISVVTAGESTGRLDMVLKQLADQLENDNNFVAKIRGAMYYPVFILCALVGIAIYMLVVVIPQLKNIFDAAQTQLPLATRVLLALSSFFRGYWWIVLIAVVALGVFCKFWFSSPSGAVVYHSFKIKTPVVKKLFEGVYMYRFCKIMSMLISAGVPLLDALKIGSSVMDNVLYEKSLIHIIAQIERGIPLSVELAKDQLFPQLVGQMAAVGEETGQLDLVLAKVAEYYEESTDQMVKTVSSLVEPIILLIMGLGVAFLVFAVLVPIYQVAQLQ